MIKYCIIKIIALLALCLLAVNIYYRSDYNISKPIYISQNLRQLVLDLERGKNINCLDDIDPAPDAVYGPKETLWYHPKGHYFLQYRLPDNKNYIIIFSKDFQYIDSNID